MRWAFAAYASVAYTLDTLQTAPWHASSTAMPQANRRLIGRRFK